MSWDFAKYILAITPQNDDQGLIFMKSWTIKLSDGFQIDILIVSSFNWTVERMQQKSV